METEKKEIGITVRKNEDFSEWYTQVVLKAELADYSPVKGCMIIKPYGYAVWENIQGIFNQFLKRYSVKNAYFPLFIPESFFKKEAAHAEGFTPEVAWVANKEEGERLAIRPTSETVMYDSFAKWIRSHRDLPLRINQWCNIVRWETKATRLFLRTREFLWQEGHCAYASSSECEKETLQYLQAYKELCEEYLAMYVIAGRKTEVEKFAGAVYTLAVETLLPDGKALQVGTSHNLGQNFARMFDVSFLDEKGKRSLVWQNSWGISTRLIGAFVMMHGDDKGLIFPPRIAPYKSVVIPIIYSNKNKIVDEARKIAAKLEGSFCDDRAEYTAGWKFNLWELKGVPLRIEFGPKDKEKKQVVMVRRDTGEKETVSFAKLEKRYKEVLEEIQRSLALKARKFVESSIAEEDNLGDFVVALEKKKMVRVAFCGTTRCEKNVKEKTTATSRVIVEEKAGGKCFACGEPAKARVLFARSY